MPERSPQNSFMEELQDLNGFSKCKTPKNASAA